MRVIDINADLGEGFGPYRIADDTKMLEIVSSANVACGFHAGDPVIMGNVVMAARARHVDVGAHVGYPDLIGFGRRAMDLSKTELRQIVLYQLGAMHAIAVSATHKVTHMSFHGALGGLALRDRSVAETLVEATRAFDSSLLVLVIPNSELERAAERVGMGVVRTFLADRAYTSQGSLVPRGVPGAIISDVNMIRARVREMIQSGIVTAIDGKQLKLQHESILVHGDSPDSLALASAIRDIAAQEGVTVKRLSQSVH